MGVLNTRGPSSDGSGTARNLDDGPGWICCVVQHCEHAAGERSTTTDLTLIRLETSAGERQLAPKDAGSALVSAGQR